MTIPKPTAEQQDQLNRFVQELRSFNQKINLISRETDEEIWVRHVQHCLALAGKRFPEGAAIVDWGTGGGLPAIPLAVMYPLTQITGVDAVRKKVQASTAIARRVGLSNVHFWHGRAERYPHSATYSVSRATAPIATLWGWHERVAGEDVAGETDAADEWKPGLICLKGGDLSAEIDALHDRYDGLTVRQTPLETDSVLEEKLIVEVYKS